MKAAILSCALILLVQTADASPKKMTIKIVSVSKSITTVGDGGHAEFEAKIILPDGSHALAGCSEIGFFHVCDLDNGYPERLTRRWNPSTRSEITTGYGDFQAKRNGKELTIYTATGSRTYFIASSW
jgi:hypothetical protein